MVLFTAFQKGLFSFWIKKIIFNSSFWKAKQSKREIYFIAWPLEENTATLKIKLSYRILLGKTTININFTLPAALQPFLFCMWWWSSFFTAAEFQLIEQRMNKKKLFYFTSNCCIETLGHIESNQVAMIKEKIDSTIK